MVSSTTVSPELTRSTGSWALSNQPHWVVSSVAGRRCIFLPFGSGSARSLGSAGPALGSAMVAVGGSGCGACASTPTTSAAPAAPANARVIIARYRMGHSPLLPAPAAKQAIGQNGPQDRQPFSQEFNAVQGRLHNR